MQSIRIGGAAATVTVTSSTPAVGQLETTLTTGDSVTVTIPIGANSSASTVAAGDLFARAKSLAAATSDLRLNEENPCTVSFWRSR